MGLKEEVGIELGGPQRIRKACEEIRGKEKGYSLPLDSTVYFKFFHNEILWTNVCKIKRENNLKENQMKKGKINEVVKRGNHPQLKKD